MNILIIYDSQYGNTKKVAGAISEGFPITSKVKVAGIEEITLKDLENINLLIVGSPTQGGRARPNLQKFIDQIDSGSLKNVNIATFDTRLKVQDLNFALKLLVKTIGYAAPKISKILVSKGGKEIVFPEGFIVKGTKGPMFDGELERAKNWSKKIIGEMKT